MIVPTIAITVRRLPRAASLSGTRSGGRLATVQTNHTAIASSTEVRSGVRCWISHGANSGRKSTNAEPAANTALSSSPTGMATWNPPYSFWNRTPAVPDCVQPHEAPGRHERQRQQQDAGISPALGGLAGRESEHERDAAHDPENDEVGPVVLEVRIEPRPEQQGDEADQRQRGRRAPTRR